MDDLNQKGFDDDRDQYIRASLLPSKEQVLLKVSTMLDNLEFTEEDGRRVTALLEFCDRLF